MREDPTLERDELLDRAGRAREFLLAAIAVPPPAAFTTDLPEHWSPGRILRHVVWTEHFWTCIIEHARDASASTVDFDRDTFRAFAIRASRLAGTPEEPVPAPPPYPNAAEAHAGLASSRARFMDAVRSTGPEDYEKRLAMPRGARSFTFAPEHVVEHDYEHALELTRMGA